ncbi:hypothetical protein LguiB_017889 [Lonicera macranthoides]
MSRIENCLLFFLVNPYDVETTLLHLKTITSNHGNNNFVTTFQLIPKLPMA